MDAYRPPEAALTEPEAPEPPRRFRLLPVLVGGFVIDYLGTSVFSLIVMVPFAVVAVRSGTPIEQLSQTVLGSPLFLWPTTVVSLGFTVLGGYVAGRWAGNRFKLHGAAAGSISFFLSLPFAFPDDGGGPLPAWLIHGGLLVQIPLAALGGWIAERRLARRCFE